MDQVTATETHPEITYCPGCKLPVQQSVRFCPHCGTLLVEIKEEIPAQVFERNTKILAAFYLVYLVVCLLAENMDVFRKFSNRIWLEVFLAVWTLLFAIANGKRLWPLYSFKNVQPLRMLMFAALAVAASLMVSTVIDWVNWRLLGEQIEYYGTYKDLSHPIPFYLISVAVYPAVFEEMGFRGIIYNLVNEAAGERNAIVVSSIAFAIMHLNVLSLIWLIPFALTAAWLRSRYQTLWYGMVIHLVFNATVCTQELLRHFN